MIRIVHCDIREATEPAVCHQTNCVSNNGMAMGVAAQVFSQWPYSNTYADAQRVKRDPGYNDYCHSYASNAASDKCPFVVNMNAQRYPGKPKYSNDTSGLRAEWFNQCLHDLGQWCQTASIDRVAMPYRIGCGLAEGNWDLYMNMLRAFCENYHVNVTLYDPGRQHHHTGHQ